MEQLADTPQYLKKEFIVRLFEIEDLFEREQRIIETEQQAKSDGKSSQFKRLLKAYKNEFSRLMGGSFENIPEYIENDNVNEISFVEHFREQYAEFKNSDIVCVNDMFYTCDGMMTYDDLKMLICDILSKYLKNNVAYKVDSIINLMKIKYYKPELKLNDNIIYFSNGDYHIDTEMFTAIKSLCKYRLPIEYNKSAKEPKKFLKYINELFYEEDIKTVQQYLGYCFIPSTKAQVMLSVIGSGGEGKSVLGNLCMSLFGESAIKGSVHSIETDRFFKANLIDKLIFIDDDVSFDAFKTTNNLKSIITADTMFTVDQKYKQPYQASIYSRILCFGNASLSSLYDKSDGFFRRQIVIVTKPKNEQRINNPNLYNELKEGLQGIVNWCLQGLQELMKNNYKIYQSSRALENLKNSKINSCNIIAFLGCEEYIKFDDECCEHTADLYSEYLYWCQENAEDALKKNTFTSYLKDNQNKYNIYYSEHCMCNDKRARGFKGLKIIKKRNLSCASNF